MFLQTHPEINKSYPYAGHGCKIASYLYWAEQVLRRHFTAWEIELLTGQMIKHNYLTTDLAVLEEYELVVPKYLSIPVERAFRAEPGYIPKLNEIAILRLDKPYFTHFVPGFYVSGSGLSVPGPGWAYAWDSLGIRKGRENYKITGLRIMTLDVSRLNFPMEALNPLR